MDGEVVEEEERTHVKFFIWKPVTLLVHSSGWHIKPILANAEILHYH